MIKTNRDPGSDAMERGIRAEQVRLLYEGLPLSLIMNVMVGMVVVFFLWPVIDHELLMGWLGALGLVVLFRAWSAYAYRRGESSPDEVMRWERLFLAGVFCAGLAWGAVSLLLFPQDDFVRQVLLVAAISGMAAGATTSLSFLPAPITIYLFCAVVPLALRLVLSGVPLAQGLGVLVLMLFVLIRVSARSIFQTTAQNIRLRMVSAADETALYQTQHMMERVLNSIPSRVYWRDRNAVLQGWNLAFAYDMGLESADQSGERMDAGPTGNAEPSRYASREDDARIMSSGQAEINQEERMTLPDGRVCWMRWSRIPLWDSSGNVTGILGTYDDITEQKEAQEQRLEDEKRQRDTLVREVHHRIKNHLQGIIGLLLSQAAEQPEIEAALKNAVGQINAIAVIHGLQSKDPGETVDLLTLLRSICVAMEQVQRRPIRLDQGVDSLPRLDIAPDEAVPLSLVLNELLQNAVKHSSEEGEEQAVTVEIMKVGGAGIAINIVNIGKGLPKTFNWNAGNGLGTGLNLVKSLLPRKGAAISIHAQGNSVLTKLELGPPVVDYD